MTTTTAIAASSLPHRGYLLWPSGLDTHRPWDGAQALRIALAMLGREHGGDGPGGVPGGSELQPRHHPLDCHISR